MAGLIVEDGGDAGGARAERVLRGPSATPPGVRVRMSLVASPCSGPDRASAVRSEQRPHGAVGRDAGIASVLVDVARPDDAARPPAPPRAAAPPRRRGRRAGRAAAALGRRRPPCRRRRAARARRAAGARRRRRCPSCRPRRAPPVPAAPPKPAPPAVPSCPRARRPARARAAALLEDDRARRRGARALRGDGQHVPRDAVRVPHVPRRRSRS